MVPEKTIRVMIADDHAMVREGLRHVLVDDPLLEVVAEAATGHEILSLILQHQPDVLLLDLDLPGQSGLDALRAVRDHVPRPPRTLVLSAFHDEEYVRYAYELGVVGFLLKNCERQSLRSAIHQVAQGRQALDPMVASMIKEQSYSKTRRFRRYTDGSPALSAAELIVLQRMLGEEPYAEIARDLHLSYRTVRSQVTTLCNKLGANSRQQAVIKGLQLGILRLNDAKTRRPHG